MKISEKFKGCYDKVTGRKMIQLTEGSRFCYPLYYFIPSITKDLRYLVYHCAENNEVQLHRLDLQTAEDVQLTFGTDEDTWWKPWCTNQGRGILDHRSVLDTENNRVIYLEHNKAYCIDLMNPVPRLLFELPADRRFIGQNCVTPDGKHYIFIHADRKLYDQMFDENNRYAWNNRGSCKDTCLCRYDFDTGAIKTLITINSPIHHVLPYGNSHVIFCHPAEENGMLLTDLEGGWYTHMRTKTDDGAAVCHYVTSKKGVMYEMSGGKANAGTNKVSEAGIYNPFTNRFFEIKMPSEFGYTHTGGDEEGRLWFFEGNGERGHNLYWLREHNPDGTNDWVQLTGAVKTYKGGQKSHFHPRLLSDRQWILMTGGDETTETNHIFLTDASDLEDTKGIEEV